MADSGSSASAAVTRQWSDAQVEFGSRVLGKIPWSYSMSRGNIVASPLSSAPTTVSCEGGEIFPKVKKTGIGKKLPARAISTSFGASIYKVKEH